MKKPQYIREFKLTSFVASQAESFSFFFDRGDWAFVFIDEKSGSVAIHSSYGDWSHSWPSPGRGDCTLKEFICHGSYDYMACKFESGRPEEFDGDATQKSFTERLLKQRRGGDIEKEEARSLYDDLEVCEWNGSVEAFYLSVDDDLKKWMGGEWYEFVSYCRKPRFYWLRDALLPLIVTELRKHIAYKGSRSEGEAVAS